jgi:putative peptidoglycan lipid II flippase
LSPDTARADSSIARAAALLMIGSVTSRFLGMVREIVIADLFGGGQLVDAFRIASNVFAIVYDMLVSGSISAAMVPVFSEYSSRDNIHHLRQVIGNLLAIIGLLLGAVVIALQILASPLVWMLASGFDPATHDLAVLMVRIVLPGVLFMSLAAVLMSGHYGLRRFLFPAFAAPALNLAVILTALALASSLGISSLALGMTVGALGLLLWQALGLRDLHPWPKLRPVHPAVGRIFRLYLPVALGLVVSAVGIVLDRNLASRTGPGSIAAMSYATTLIQFALGVVGAAISLAVLPVLSRQSADADSEAFVSTLARGMGAIIFLILPATALLASLGSPVISLLFEHGAFGEAEHARTLLALTFYLPGLPFSALDQLLIYAFYAMRNTITPVSVGVAGVAVYLVVALALIGPLGMPGLVIANSVQLIFHATVMAVLLHMRVKGLDWNSIGASLWKCVAAALICWIVASAALKASAGLPDSLATRIVVTLGPGALAIAAYVATAAMLRVQELQWLVLGPLRQRRPVWRL